MKPPFSDLFVIEYATSADAVAVLYVRDRVARLYLSDLTGVASTGDLVSLSDLNAMRFVCWNHQQCYGPLATGTCNN